MESFALLVGLGNPGPRYEQTRHNAGFWFVEAAARRLHAQLRFEKRFHGDVAECDRDAGKLRLLKPDTWMNRSGRAVGAVAGFFKIPAERVLVAYDEIDLPPGTVRLKTGGGAGGHNGLRDIIAHLGTPEFTRLRIGVGHPGLSDEVADYVLNRPGKAEQSKIESAIDAAIDILPDILDGDLARAMRVLHTKPKENDHGNDFVK